MPEDTLPADAVPLQTQPTNRFALPEPIDITLPDGRKITMAMPKVALSRLIGVVLANMQYQSAVVAETDRNRVKSLMYITHINDTPEPIIQSDVMRDALEQKIGPQFLDALFVAWNKYFPDVDVDQLKVVKKS